MYSFYVFTYLCAADGALRIDISVHENDLENMAKGKEGTVWHQSNLNTFIVLCEKALIVILSVIWLPTFI